MPVLIEYFLQVNKPKGECEALILTLGTSYEPLVFSISALQPSKVLILYTEKTLHLLDDVIEFTKLKPSQYTATEIGAENPLQLYREIKNIYEKWNRPKNIYVDFTGGRKSMSAGCAMAGSAINAKLIYITGEYMPSLGKPTPGSERLIEIDDPYTVFGDLEMEQAISLFNKMDYISAYRIFDDLEQRVPGITKKYSALKYISKAYDSWDSLDINGAKYNLSKCLDIIETEDKLSGNFILSKQKGKLRKQLDVLNVLQKMHCNNNSKNKNIIYSNVGYLIANLYQNAIRREKQKKYETASLLLYRILEAIEQKRLWNYGIDTSNADYSILPVDKETLLNKINRNIGSDKINHLKNKIDLLFGYILLAALKDEIIKPNKPGKEKNLLNELRGKVDARNHSIFAHGYNFIDDKEYYDFKKTVDKYIDKICKLESIDKEELFDACEFITL